MRRAIDIECGGEEGHKLKFLELRGQNDEFSRMRTTQSWNHVFI